MTTRAFAGFNSPDFARVANGTAIASRRPVCLRLRPSGFGGIHPLTPFGLLRDKIR
jgi:hypothetical protein